MDETAVALGRLALAKRVGEGVEPALGLAFRGGFGAGLATKIALAVEGLGDGCGAAYVGEHEDVDLEEAALVANGKEVVQLQVAGRLGGLAVAGDVAGVAGPGGERAGLEEAPGPEPFIDAETGHTFMLI